MASRVRIRAVDATDLEIAEEIQEMHRVCFGYAADLTDFGFWWIGYDKDEPVCFAGLWKSQQYENAGYLCRAGVMPPYRGLGLQRRLLTVRERKARALGWSQLVTDTTDNPPSANNVIRAGFVTFLPVNRWGPSGAVYWTKSL
jgi:GNAT superfamily N-acetyltransferase